MNMANIVGTANYRVLNDDLVSDTNPEPEESFLKNYRIVDPTITISTPYFSADNEDDLVLIDEDVQEAIEKINYETISSPRV